MSDEVNNEQKEEGGSSDEVVSTDDAEESVSSSDSESNAKPSDNTSSSSEEDEEEVVISIEGVEEESQEEKDYEKAPGWVRDLRKSNREIQSENNNLKKKLSELSKSNVLENLQKPAYEDEDIAYDSEKYERKLSEWINNKNKKSQEAAKRQIAENIQQEEWKSSLDSYSKDKASLKVKDFEESEAVVLETLSETQQAIIIKGSKNPALLVYALGKNYSRARSFGDIDDNVRFTFEVSNFERSLSMKPRKNKTSPEKTVQASSMGSSEAKLNKLREESLITGDHTKAFKYMRELRRKKME
jgi:hypothetical protein